MVRATRGHTGRELVAGRGGVAVFVAILAAALIRIVAAAGMPDTTLNHLSGTLWSAAFFGFALLHGKALLTHRARRFDRAARSAVRTGALPRSPRRS